MAWVICYVNTYSWTNSGLTVYFPSIYFTVVTAQTKIAPIVPSALKNIMVVSKLLIILLYTKLGNNKLLETGAQINFLFLSMPVPLTVKYLEGKYTLNPELVQ